MRYGQLLCDPWFCLVICLISKQSRYIWYREGERESRVGAKVSYVLIGWRCMYGNPVTRLPVITPSRTSTLVLGKEKCNKTLAAKASTKGGKEEGRQELYIICRRNVPLSLISVGNGGTTSLVQ